MDFEYYLNKFNKAADAIHKKELSRKHLEKDVGIVLDSVFLKLYKPAWTNDLNNPLNAEARIFFSIWINDKTIEEGKLYYNIHAFKLRKLKGHAIASKKFAERFREQFKKFQSNWKNVSISFGPLTLMEGWIELDENNIEKNVLSLANNFLEIDFLIDNVLKTFEK
ncbi:MAG: hypothetical protein JST71_09815 [Bacteroidetes bacterium]|nr:hypothetical protein [Bacteroidota bacterium]MBS1923670.1 hypothetical protein [Bacteroidota bacterium]